MFECEHQSIIEITSQLPLQWDIYPIAMAVGYIRNISLPIAMTMGYI